MDSICGLAMLFAWKARMPTVAATFTRARTAEMGSVAGRLTFATDAPIAVKHAGPAVGGSWIFLFALSAERRFAAEGGPWGPTSAALANADGSCGAFLPPLKRQRGPFKTLSASCNENTSEQRSDCGRIKRSRKDCPAQRNVLGAERSFTLRLSAERAIGFAVMNAGENRGGSTRGERASAPAGLITYDAKRRDCRSTSRSLGSLSMSVMDTGACCAAERQSLAIGLRLRTLGTLFH